VITLKEEEALNQWLDEQLKVGLIVESKSRYTAPCFYIPKEDGSLQLVQDYRKLNQVMIKDKMLLPLIREVIDKLKEAKYFNKLDLIWEYNNVWIKEEDEWKATFLTNKGLFEPQVMYFGLCNSPGTFQQMMNSIFRELLHEGILANYMDNFVIPAKTIEELEERLQHEGNPYLRGGCWQRTDSNGTRKDQGSKEMEDADKSERCRKLSRICKLLSMLYTKLQPHCQAIKQTKRQERVEMGRGTSKSI